MSALPTRTSRSRHLRFAAVAMMMMSVIGLWAWTAGLSGPYHFDDYITPLNDPASQSLAAWRQHLPVTLRPISKLSYAVEAEAGWTAEPAPRRVVSLLLHALSAGLLFSLIVRLAPASTLLGAALLAALWFLHPVHADNVLLLSGRTAVLSGLFLLAALLALDRARSWSAALLFVLACLSRETALAGLLPLAVLAASRPGTSFRSMLRQLAPVLLGGALILAWIFTTPRYLHLAEYSFFGRPFWSSLASQVGAVPVGLGVLFNPAALSIDYGIPLPARISDPRFLLGLVLFGGAAAGVVVFLRRSPAVAVGLALWLAALLPTQSLVPKLDALTNRPLALALAGLLLLAAPFTAAVINRVRAHAMRTPGLITDSSRAAGRLAATGFAITLIALLAAATAGRAELFESELTLWRDAAVKSRVNARPHLQYAKLLKDEGQDQEAYNAVLVARAIDPFSSQAAFFARVYGPQEVPR